jgi:dihydrofolate synthase/folylpolyglutamate synthase
MEADLPRYQRINAAVALATANAAHPGIDPAVARRAVELTPVPGRFTRLADDPLTIVDGAHNPAGMAALAAALPDEPVTAVVSILDDKDAAAMLRALLPHCSALVCTSSSNPRALSPATLASLAAQLGGVDEDHVTLESDPREALRRARELGSTVVATGSIYLAADLLSAPGTRRASAL